MVYHRRSYRRRTTGSGGLTGGTGDVRPQWFRITSATQATAQQTISTQASLPVQRLKTRGKSQVMEILAVRYFDSLIYEMVALTDNTKAMHVMALTTSFVSNTNLLTVDNPRVIDMALPFSAAKGSTTTCREGEAFIIHKLDDGAGHGILVAADQLYLNYSTQNTAMGIISPASALLGFCCAWVLYRMVNVGITEYIGILQSEQA